MRTKIVWLTAIFIVFMGFGLSQGQVVNLLENGGFETGDMAPWTTYGPVTTEVVTDLTGAAVPEAPIEGDYCLHIVVPSAGANFWDAGLQHRGHSAWESGKKYTLSAFLKSKSGELNINFKPEQDGDPWTGYGEQAFTVTEEWTEFSTTTPVFTANVDPASITFHIQYDVGDFWIDAVRWYEGDYVPPVLGDRAVARSPNPADGAIQLNTWVSVSWLPGEFADKHNVYMGTDANDVNEASLDDQRGVLVAQDLDDASFDPPGDLDYGVTYYWRVDEIGDANSWKGNLWSFTVLNYPVVVDDFEDYNDYPPNEIWNTWIDGFGDPTNGSTAGYPDPDFNDDEHYVETEIVHSGLQSMPVFYDNVAGLSEVTRSFTSPMNNWTREGVATLTLFYYGDADNAAEPMYVALNGSAVVANEDLNAALVTDWTQWDIPLQAFADQGVNLSNVSSMSIGFGNKANPVAGGGSGHVFFDDIRLYLP